MYVQWYGALEKCTQVDLCIWKGLGFRVYMHTHDELLELDEEELLLDEDLYACRHLSWFV